VSSHDDAVFQQGRPSRRRIVALGLWAAPTLAFPRALVGPLAQVSCRRISPDGVVIEWRNAPAGGVVEVFLSHAPDGPFDHRLDDGHGDRWQGAAAIAPRPYFRLSAAGGAAETAERVLPLQGGRNFRDLGGYRSADGRMVRWGRLYRSGEMADLTPADYRYLNDLGVVAVCDLRSTSERQAAPTQWASAHPPSYYARDYTIDPAALHAVLASAEPTPAAMRQAMIETYAGFPYDFVDSYREIFSEILKGRLPLAFNCSAGKDRSGVAAALILTALGVPHDQVLADYLLTNEVFSSASGAAGQSAHRSASEDRLARLPPDVRAALMSATPDYLESAFAAIKTRDGSIENYLQTRLALGPREIVLLRQQLLKRV
jgi:protein-tyrosine phosphatase